MIKRFLSFVLAILLSFSFLFCLPNEKVSADDITFDLSLIDDSVHHNIPSDASSILSQISSNDSPNEFIFAFCFEDTYYTNPNAWYIVLFNSDFTSSFSSFPCYNSSSLKYLDYGCSRI